MDEDKGMLGTLRALGYRDGVCGSGCQCQCEDAQCSVFPPLILWLLSQLRDSGGLEQDSSSPGQGCDGSACPAALEQLSAALEELHCPHPALGHGLDSAHARRTAIEFLVSELQATQILQARERHQGEAEGARTARGGEEETRGEGKAGTEEGQGEARAVDKDTGDSGEMERELVLLCQALDLQPETQPSSLLTVVQGEVVSRLARLPGGAPPRPLLKLPLTSEQWARMEEIHQALRQEYECRRHMMIKRFQVTVGSFHWGERGQDRSRLMSTVLQPLEGALSPLPATSLCHLLAAREDQSRIVATSCGEARRVTCCAVNKVLMGSVPDRGGRPGEIEPPMPSWGARRQGGGGRGGRRYSGKKKNKKKE